MSRLGMALEALFFFSLQKSGLGSVFVTFSVLNCVTGFIFTKIPIGRTLARGRTDYAKICNLSKALKFLLFI